MPPLNISFGVEYDSDFHGLSEPLSAVIVRLNPD